MLISLTLKEIDMPYVVSGLLSSSLVKSLGDRGVCSKRTIMFGHAASRGVAQRPELYSVIR